MLAPFNIERNPIMARKPISMHKIKEILRLKHELKLSDHQIGASLHLSHVSVGQYLRRAQQAGIAWPIPEGLDETQLRQTLRAAQKSSSASAPRYLPPMAEIHRQLQRKGVTLQLLWEEYRRDHPDGYGHSQFWRLYRNFSSQLEPVLRQHHPPGERMFVDWAGMTFPLLDPSSGQSRAAQLFVATLGASSYTFAEAFENTKLPSWIEGHIHAWEFFGGVTRLTVPDNPKTAITDACYYEPKIHRSYQELAEHYGTVILPARPRRPQDKE
jgi:transposase